MLAETLRFTSEKPNIKIIWWVRLKFPVLSFHGASSLPPHSGLSNHFSFSALPCRNVSWDESEQDFQAVALLHLAPTKQQAKNAYFWGLAAPFIHLEGSPSDSLVIPRYCFFLNRRIIENIRLERTSGGHLVQSPAQSFIIRSGCSRSRSGELLKISRRYHSNLGHLFQCLTTFIGKNPFPALSIFMVCSLLACAPSVSA